MDPAKIWLLFGLPICEERFVARLIDDAETAARSDFLAKYDAPGAPVAKRLEHIQAGWTGDYADWVARPLSALAARGRGIGAHVIEDATCADITRAAGEAEVLILVSHWKGAEFSNEDFLAGLAETVRARAWKDPLFRWIEAAVAPPCWMKRLLGSSVSLRQALRESLHVDLGPAEAVDGVDGIDCFLELPATRAARRRALIDVRLEGHIRPGNRLELFDGLFSREDIARAVAGFVGVIDLTTCTSTYLADFIGHACGQACRTVQFLDVQEPVDAMARLTSTLDLVAAGSDYLTARAAVARAFGAVVDAMQAKGIQNEQAQ